MDFNYDGTFDLMASASSIHGQDQFPDFTFGFGVPDWDQFNFDPLATYTADGGHTFAPFPPLQPPADTYPLLLSPLESSEPSGTPSFLPFPALDLPLAGPSSAQSTTTQQIPLPPPTLPTPTFQPTPTQIRGFDFCPYTRHGQVCGYVSWACSSNKQIKRHMKAEHFPDTSLGYECPNPECTSGGYRFVRKDLFDRHRRTCDLLQTPGYIPLPNVVTGNDTEVNRWMKARLRQKGSIMVRLKNGTPWSEDILEPVSP